jgi:conjugative relaxase-like TrwC/TraI family protein
VGVLRLCSILPFLRFDHPTPLWAIYAGMWTMAKMRDGAQWLSNHYAANDYYCEDEEVIGIWVGRASEIFGIAGLVIEPQDARFLNIFSGKTPNGENLKQRQSEIIGYDFQCSAQKSVSIMAIVGGDERLIEAHRNAVAEAYAALETLACVKQGEHGVDRQRLTTGILCSARFDHDSSRALDPHLHTHFATANFSMARDGTRYALETHDMVKAIRYAGKIYQSALRRSVENLGYSTRDKFDARGLLEGFEIDGISDELCEKYSQRRSEIEEQIGVFKAQHGREPTPAEIHVMAKETRGAKLTEISTQEVRVRQRARASPDELEQIARTCEQAMNARTETRGDMDAAELVALVRDHLAERRATFGEHDLIAEALNRGMGKVTLDSVVRAIRADPELVRLDAAQNAMALLTDRTNLAQERESVAFVNAGVGKTRAINDQFVPFPDLTLKNEHWLALDRANGVTHDYTEQREAVLAMLKSTDQVFALRGVAGAGKTTALKEFHAGVLAAGRTHILLAPTRGSVKSLAQEVRGAVVDTVAGFLLRANNGLISVKNAVITVDEWGLLSNRAGHALLSVAKSHGADVRFVGDTRQHVSVEAGDFGRTLEKHSALRSVTLSKISRQRDPDYREAVAAMAEKRTQEGLAKLDQKGWIHEEKSAYLIEAARRYLFLTEFGSKLLTERGEAHVLAVAPTHAEIRAFTADVREQMQEQGSLTGVAIKRRAFVAYDSTRAARRSSQSYVPGLAVTVISEKTKVRGLAASEVYTVTKTPKKDFVTLVGSDGKERTINVRKNGEKLELGTIQEIELEAGDRLWFRANAKGITNGTLATLAGTDSQGRLVTTDGVVVPEDYLKVAYGYATTSHASQGLTAEFGVVFGAKFDQKSIYVAHSRARERTDTFVPSKDAFLSRAERSQGERLGVLEAISSATKERSSLAKPTIGNGSLSTVSQERLALEAKIGVQRTRMAEEREYLVVPYAERDQAKALGAKWDWREKLWYIGPESERDPLTRWLPENIPAAREPVDPREEFAAVLRNLGADLTGDHPVMDGKPHRVATLDDDRREKSMFYVGHLDGRPAGYAKNNRTGEEDRWKASVVTMTKEQFQAAGRSREDREADRMALYSRTAERLVTELESYTSLDPRHPYLENKRIGPREAVFQTARGSMAIPAYDIDAKLWSIQYVSQDGIKRFAKQSRKEGCFHVVAEATHRGHPVEALKAAKAVVIAEGYATAATLREQHDRALTAKPSAGVQFVAAYDAGNVPAVAQAIRERYPDLSIVIAADNDLKQVAEHGRNPGLEKAELAARAVGAVVMAPQFTDEETLEYGYLSDWNDLATKTDRAAEISAALEAATAAAENERLKWAEAKDQVVPQNQGHDHQWSLTAGVPEQKQEPPVLRPPLPREPSLRAQNEWHFRVTSNGEIEHYRVATGKVGVRETAEKIHILERSDDAFALALERAQSRFGQHLHFNGSQAGVERLVNIVLEKDLHVTFTDARINARIDLARAQKQPIPTRDAGIASVSTPEKEVTDAVSQPRTREILIGHGDAPFDFQPENKPNYFVRTIADTGAEKLYWGKDLPRALEESGANIGDLIRLERTGTKLVTMKDLQEQPDGRKLEVETQTRRNAWTISGHGVDHDAVIKAYDAHVQTSADRQRFEERTPEFVALRDQAVRQLKREQLQTELRQREQRTQVNHQLIQQ